MTNVYICSAIADYVLCSALECHVNASWHASAGNLMVWDLQTLNMLNTIDDIGFAILECHLYLDLQYDKCLGFQGVLYYDLEYVLCWDIECDLYSNLESDLYSDLEVTFILTLHMTCMLTLNVTCILTLNVILNVTCILTLNVIWFMTSNVTCIQPLKWSVFRPWMWPLS